ncbi:MAG: hypothetical protein N2516_03305 [Dictyoglomaceae bacterium]|jgi:hypothetical protein|nr:hypothetical protein [Dictyoglomaceae bacterium]
MKPIKVLAKILEKIINSNLIGVTDTASRVPDSLSLSISIADE